MLPSPWSQVLLRAVAVVSLAAAPVPSPVHVQPGVAEGDGRVSWVPAVQRVTGDAGELVAVDLGLDDGTDGEIVADLAVRDVEIDPDRGAQVVGSSPLLRLAVDRIVLGPGDRGVLRAVAEMPEVATVVAVQARLDDGDTAPAALVLLDPGGADPAELDVGIELAGERARVTVTNRGAAPALVDLAVTSSTWAGPSDEIQLGDVLVGAEGTRRLEVELSRGLGRRTAAVALAVRGAPPDERTRAAAAAWPARTLWVLAGAALVVIVGGAAVRTLRRS
ncbi:MAG: hypothetical protein KY461_11970 [Actinobacteria bacterium]|nr:hypothetical protein [Actinomycetota bacterium]